MRTAQTSVTERELEGVLVRELLNRAIDEGRDAEARALLARLERLEVRR